MTDFSDAELIQRFRHGQLHSFNLLVWRWQKPIFNFLYRFLSNQQDAEDACQKTFLKVYQKLSALKETDKFRLWLYQVAANEARDQLRQRKRQPQVSLDAISESRSDAEAGGSPEYSDPATPETDRNLYLTELRQIFAGAMKEIPAEQRVVIVMKIYQGLKFIEIAEILQESQNTIKSRMYYGLKTLRQVLQKQNFSEEVLNYEL